MNTPTTRHGRFMALWRWLGLLAAVLAFAVSAGVGSLPEPGRAATARVQADLPACRYEHLYLTVERMAIRQMAGGGEKWLETQLTPPQRIDLMAVGGGLLQALGAAPLAAGDYTEVRLLLVASKADGSLANAVQSIGGRPMPLSVPGGAQGGIKLRGDFHVPAGQTADLVLENFNACASVVQAGNSGQYHLRPVLAVQARVVAANAEQRIEGPVSALIGGSGYLSVRREADAVVVRRYDTQGRPVGSDTRIEVSAVPGGQLISTTALVQGGYVLAWLGPSPNPSARWDADYPLIVQRYTASGAFLGAEQAAVTQPFARRFYPPALPQVTALPAGGYVLAWAQYAEGGFNLYSRRYGADGTPAGLAQLVAASPSGPLNGAASAGGGYILAWGYLNLFARAYGPDDMALGPVQAVGDRLGEAGLPADGRTGLAALAGGGAVVTWADQTAFGIYIHARRLSTDGSPVGEAFIVDGSTPLSPGLELQMNSSVAGLPNGGYVVVWMAPGGVIYGRRFAADGSPLGRVTRINTAASDLTGPTVVASGDGGFVVTWSAAAAPNGPRLTYGRFFDARGLLGGASS